MIMLLYYRMLLSIWKKMITKELETKLNNMKAELEYKLERELQYIDRKEEVHHIRLVKQIARIEGFLLSKDYYKLQKCIYYTKE